jgi:spore maturation protein CgeB/ubiquinone/menaquinone biosynthesis C-methylase UbiE
VSGPNPKSENMEAGDRISELYKGEIFAPETQSIARERIDWMCRQAEGQKVIDIGCSQGIVSILLAREGFQVIGVDTNAQAIEYANSDRAKEPPEVQQRLAFVLGDICGAELPEQQFDTAIMGEFLEHLDRPGKAIARAYEILGGAGKLVVTVPFGLFEDPDHKQTFYMASLYKLMYPYFAMTEIQGIGRYLCLLCEKRGAPLERQMDSIDLALVERGEQEFLRRETALATEIAARKKEAREYKAGLARERRVVQMVRSSLSFRLGNMLVEAVSKPGLNTVLLPYRVLRLGMVAVRRRPGPKTTAVAGRKAHVFKLVEERIGEIKKEMASGALRSPVPRRTDLKIATIMDRFTYDCFKYEANLITFTPQNWQQLLSRGRPDLLFVESAWQGNNASWNSQILNLGQRPDSQLPQLVQWCRAQKIPTAFWNKEDPAHYHDFLDAARLCDYVFTTDADCVEKYRSDLGHGNVFCLPFAIQPRIHNPIGSGQKIRDVAFAGSWYEGETEYRKTRKEQMANILAPALQYDVDIYDRYSSLNNDRYRFPEQYQPCIVGQLPYDEMVYAYKMYKIFLNVSSVVDSPTMFPRRVLEVLASGTYVLSGYSRGIENLIGADIVKMPSSPEETTRCLQELLGDEELKDRLAHLGLRKVMKEHTYKQRLDYILDVMGIGHSNGTAKEKGVSIVTSTNKLVYMDNIFANYDRQQYEQKELIIVIGNDKLDLRVWEEEARKRRNVRVYRVDETMPLGACLNFGIDKARFGYIAKCDDDDYFGPAYLDDLMMAFDYSGADIVGKCARYVHFESGNVLAIKYPDREHQFTDTVSGSAMIVRREVFNKVRFDPTKRVGEDTKFLKDCVTRGVRIYSADRFNFAYIRKSSPDLHTWRVGDEDLLGTSGQFVSTTSDYGPYVTC